ncbi:MAG: methyltransferase domain-containing protein [Actinomycetota bacterium]
MPDYPLKLSEAELSRYRLMAEAAMRMEHALWDEAGIVEGAVVADIGCGPGAVSAVMAGLVGPAGRVVAVDQEPEAVEAARASAAAAGAGNVTVTVGAADDTGIEPGSVDVAMIRHVLAHNGGREQAIVDHAASLVRPGGCVYLVDIDGTRFPMRPPDADMDDLAGRYERWHAARGNDLAVGLRLAELLEAAGLEVVDFQGRVNIIRLGPGFRPPGWAARDALVADGLASTEDLARWARAFERLDATRPGPTVFPLLYFAVGRRPA